MIQNYIELNRVQAKNKEKGGDQGWVIVWPSVGTTKGKHKIRLYWRKLQDAQACGPLEAPPKEAKFH